ncbi:hypothetical protein PQR66_26800 [Paraburkholderia agricolaris]|uniref:Uncharacterized protein n=1 Tax=Paraburkholderia agricolaris TaxID=2152888 RepID=A0ABW8ZVM1_9BURK
MNNTSPEDASNGALLIRIPVPIVSGLADLLVKRRTVPPHVRKEAL